MKTIPTTYQIKSFLKKYGLIEHIAYNLPIIWGDISKKSHDSQVVGLYAQSLMSL